MEKEHKANQLEAHASPSQSPTPRSRQSDRLLARIMHEDAGKAIACSATSFSIR